MFRAMCGILKGPVLLSQLSNPLHIPRLRTMLCKISKKKKKKAPVYLRFEKDEKIQSVASLAPGFCYSVC